MPRSSSAPSLVVRTATLPTAPATAAAPLDAAFPLGRALGSLWALNAARHPPSPRGRGCPLLPRVVPVADAYAGMVVELDEERFHAGHEVGEGEGKKRGCPYLQRKLRNV